MPVGKAKKQLLLLIEKNNKINNLNYLIGFDEWSLGV